MEVDNGKWAKLINSQALRDFDKQEKEKAKMEELRSEINDYLKRKRGPNYHPLFTDTFIGDEMTAEEVTEFIEEQREKKNTPKQELHISQKIIIEMLC